MKLIIYTGITLCSCIVVTFAVNCDQAKSNGPQCNETVSSSNEHNVSACPKNEEWVDCSICQRTCATYYLDVFYKCACIPGCHCVTGYIRNSKCKCVKIEDCKEKETQCTENAYFSYSDIRKTCRNPQGDGITTTGCFCPSDMLYDEDRRKCVNPMECAT